MTTESGSPLVTRLKQLLVGLALLGIGLLVGLYLLAPNLARADEGYLPRAILEMPAGMVQFVNPDGSTALLPVRLAETVDACRFGLREAGPRALETLFLLYAHPREVTRTSYTTEGIRVPLELAIIDPDGVVIAVRRVEPGTRSVSIAERHRWVLAAREGLFAHYGIATESVLDVENIRKKTLVAGN